MVKIKSLEKHYGKQLIFEGLNLEFLKDKIYVILGPSGVGKSTLLNMIAGIDRDYNGIIQRNTENISYVFQEDRLLPWLNISENIEFVLKEKKDFSKILKILEIYDIRRKIIRNLSGGQKQRVAIARAFAVSSDLIIMDESLKSLDLHLKYSIIDELIELVEENKSTMICVSHDIDEALLLADRVIILNKDGAIEKYVDIGLERKGRRKKREELLNYELEIIKTLKI